MCRPQENSSDWQRGEVFAFITLRKPARLLRSLVQGPKRNLVKYFLINSLFGSKIFNIHFENVFCRKIIYFNSASSKVCNFNARINYFWLLTWLVLTYWFVLWSFKNISLAQLCLIKIIWGLFEKVWRTVWSLDWDCLFRCVGDNAQ